MTLKKRYFFEIAYHGSAFHGWQRQENAITVQQLVEEALEKLFQEKLSITGSGRTDTGVHCKQQFFHCDLPEIQDQSRLLYQLNSILPQSIYLSRCYEMSNEAHSRFDAVERHYKYYISTVKNPFSADTAYHLYKKINLRTMNQAASLVLGEKDFTSFSKVRTEVNNFVCTITESAWQEENNLLIYTVRANRFLRGMVRTLVGSCLEVGLGNKNPEWLAEIIDEKDRRAAGRSVPAHGLFLTEVIYPQGYFKTK